MGADTQDGSPERWHAVPVGCRVLIVDDSPPFLDAASALLSVDGFEVIGTAPDGHTAIAMAASRRPELVVLDIGLPDIDGFTVAERLTESAAPPRVILVSSRDWSDLASRLIRCRASGFLPKDQLDGPRLMTLLETTA